MSKQRKAVTDKIAEKVAQSLDDPSSVSFDGVSVSNRSIPDIIKAADYLAQQEAARSPTMGMRLGKFIPPGH